MMGRQRNDQAQFFYSSHLEERVPAGHLLRKIDVFVTQALTDIHREIAAFYSHTGRPSVDPELMMRMLIVGYCYGIRSERKLCEEVSLNLACRWFCRLDLDDAVPDHSTFSKNRHGRFRDSDRLRLVFERVVGIGLAAGLIKGDGFAGDASIIEADASRYHGIAPEKIDWNAVERPSRAVREYLEALDGAAEPEVGRKAPKVISPSDPASAWTAKANMLSRNVLRSIHEEARDQARQLAGTPQFATSRNERKKVEMLFAHLKTTLRFERMRLRGLTGARDEFRLAAMVQNLRRMARLTAAAAA